MDQTLLVNVALMSALMLLAISALIMVLCMVPLISQGIRTLNSVEDLAETVNREIPPTVGEVREILAGLDQLRSTAARSVTQVGTKLEDVSGSVNNAVVTAQKHSSVFGAGVFAGVRAFFAGPGERDGNAAPPERQIQKDRTQPAVERGEQNVELKQ